MARNATVNWPLASKVVDIKGTMSVDAAPQDLGRGLLVARVRPAEVKRKQTRLGVFSDVWRREPGLRANYLHDSE